MDYSSFSIVYWSRKLRKMPLWSLCICQRFLNFWLSIPISFWYSIVTSWEFVYRDLSSDQACQFAVFRVLLMAPWISWFLGLWWAIYCGMHWALTFQGFLVAQIRRSSITTITIVTKLIIIIIRIIIFITLMVQQKRFMTISAFRDLDPMNWRTICKFIVKKSPKLRNKWFEHWRAKRSMKEE